MAATAASPVRATPEPAVAPGLKIEPGTPYASWRTLGQRILGISKASPWCIGDWLVYGQEAYGDRYRSALGTTDFDYQTLRNYAWVARRFTLSRRRDRLSFQHHAEVAALPEVEQELWLERAQANAWSRNELRRRMASRRSAPGPEAASVTVRVRVSRDRRNRWCQGARASHEEFDLWVADALDRAADAALEPVHPAPSA
jgi:hypothetical protein